MKKTKPATPTFEEAWAAKEAEGYQYGRDALEQVRFGWEIRESYVSRENQEVEDELWELRNVLITAVVMAGSCLDPAKEQSREVLEFRKMLERVRVAREKRKL